MAPSNNLARLHSEVQRLLQQIAAASSGAVSVAELVQAQSSDAAKDLVTGDNEAVKLQQLVLEKDNHISLLQSQIAAQQQQLQQQGDLLAECAVHEESAKKSAKKQCVASHDDESACGELLGKTQDEVILEFVLPSWLSASEYVFLASISSEWRRRMLKRCYENFKLKEIAAQPKKLPKHVVPVATAINAALESSVRLQWALDNNKIMRAKDSQLHLPASKKTLFEFVARVIDVATDPAAVLEVAKLDDIVQSLQQLNAEKGCLLCAKAAAKGDKELFKVAAQ
jgi:hypothetical protein